jgi:hypothetical protein
VTRGEKEAGRREDILRQEISDIQQRLQDAEDRNHELTASVSAGTHAHTLALQSVIQSLVCSSHCLFVLRPIVCSINKSINQLYIHSFILSFMRVYFVAATRPLLRQIENLQSTHASQTLSYEKIEKNLTDRLGMLCLLS